MQQVDILLFLAGQVMLPIIMTTLHMEEHVGKVRIIFHLVYLLKLVTHSKKMLMAVIKHLLVLKKFMVKQSEESLVMTLTKTHNIITLLPLVSVQLLLIAWQQLGVCVQSQAA